MSSFDTDKLGPRNSCRVQELDQISDEANVRSYMSKRDVERLALPLHNGVALLGARVKSDGGTSPARRVSVRRSTVDVN